MEKETLFLFEGLTQEERTCCWEKASPTFRTYEKGEVIYDKTRVQRALVLVQEGEVRVLYGRVVMNHLHAGDVFGAAALFGEDESYFSQVVAASRCRVAFLEQAAVAALMTVEPRIAVNYIRFLSDRIRFLNRRLSTLTAGATDGKLWRFLCTHRDEQGVVQMSGGLTELARALDMGRSSLYRSLDLLTQAGKIQRQGKKIIVLETEEDV